VAGARDFFADPRPGPKTAPGKDAARARIIELRAQGHSIDEIGTVLAREGVALNRTGIHEVITEAGLPRIWRRRDAARGGPRREDLPRARALADEDYPDVTGQLTGGHPTRLAGLLLALPDLLALDLPGLVDAAGYPGTRDIPAISYLLSLLALKLTATRRVSHVHDVAGDPAAALFTGLTALPKTTALTTYSYRVDHARQAAFLTALDKAAIRLGLAAGEVVNLDFHAVMHWGQDPALEKHYVPSRSQRTRSVLTFFAEDADSHALLYANADLAKANQAGEVMAFADHWKTVTGHDPDLLVMDSKVTTQDQLWALTERGIGFITLRARTPKVTAALHALPAKAWTSMTVARAGGKSRTVRVIDDPAANCRSTRNPAPARRRRTGPRRTHPADQQPRRPARQTGHRDLRPAHEHSNNASPKPSAPSAWTPSPAPSPSTSTSTSCSPCLPTPSAPPCAGACPATPPPPPTPCNADS
jgi:hypothetical protein